MIYTAFSPNTRKKDYERAKDLYYGKVIPSDTVLEDHIERYKVFYPDSEVFLYNYARSAMYEIFKALEIDSGDEIVFQAFTCIAAVNPAVWLGARPVYVDIDKDQLFPSAKKIIEAVNFKTKAIVIQYTFGFHPEIQKIAKFAADEGITLIEDCTHVIPDLESQTQIGRFGDAAIFSYGRDKVVSGVDGGVAVVRDSTLSRKISDSYRKLDKSDHTFVRKELFHTLMWWFLKKLSYFGQGWKAAHLLAKKVGWVSFATTPDEKQGKKPSHIPEKLSNELADLALLQLDDIEELNSHRREIARIYDKHLHDSDIVMKWTSDWDLAPVRYPVKIEVEDMQHFMKSMESKGIYLGDWYRHPISPLTANPLSVAYIEDSCPNAQELGRYIVNLPTHINISEDSALHICEEINDYLENIRNG